MSNIARQRTRLRTFTTNWVLKVDESSNWTLEDSGGQLDEKVNTWLAELDVPVAQVSSPSITVIGTDSSGRLHLILAVNVLYVAEEIIDDRGDTGAGPALGDALQQLVNQLPRGVKLGDVVRFAQDGDARPAVEGTGDFNAFNATKQLPRRSVH